VHNCIIIGSGRSGTSLAAGLLYTGKYYIGENVIPPSPANPKGFFESDYINTEINEAILNRWRGGVRKGHWWLTRVPHDTSLTSTLPIRRKMRVEIAKAPYCFKDPRFCYTAHLWKPYLQSDTKFVCIFRNPAATAHSMYKEYKVAKYLAKMDFNPLKGFRVWEAMYNWILSVHDPAGEWLYLDFDDLVYGGGAEKLSRYLKAPIRKSFIDRKLDRSSKKYMDEMSWDPKIREIYNELLYRAGCYG